MDVGIVLTLLTAVVSRGGFLFGAPGAVYIVPATAYYGYGYYSTNRRTISADKANMIISAAGPVLNLIFAVFFFGLFYLSQPNSFIETISAFGFGLNVGLGSFNMIPFPPLDGHKIFKNNIILGMAIALPLWAMFAYFYIL